MGFFTVIGYAFWVLGFLFLPRTTIAALLGYFIWGWHLGTWLLVVIAFILDVSGNLNDCVCDYEIYEKKKDEGDTSNYA